MASAVCEGGGRRRIRRRRVILQRLWRSRRTELPRQRVAYMFHYTLGGTRSADKTSNQMASGREMLAGIHPFQWSGTAFDAAGAWTSPAAPVPCWKPSRAARLPSLCLSRPVRSCSLLRCRRSHGRHAHGGGGNESAAHTSISQPERNQCALQLRCTPGKSFGSKAGRALIAALRALPRLRIFL